MCIRILLSISISVIYGQNRRAEDKHIITQFVLSNRGRGLGAEQTKPTFLKMEIHCMQSVQRVPMGKIT